MAEEVAGSLAVVNNANARTIRLNGEEADVLVGGGGVGGDIALYRASSPTEEVGDLHKATIHFEAQQANLRMGGNGADGDLLLFRTNGDPTNDATATVHLDAQNANLRIGETGIDAATIQLLGGGGFLTLGHPSRLVFGAGMIVGGLPGQPVFCLLNATLRMGGSGENGHLAIEDKEGNARIVLDGKTGDIKLSGADCAEDFHVRNALTILPGTVLVIADDDMLEPCSMSCDSRVAGVVSGAGDLHPGIRLNSSATTRDRVPVALAGKANCLVDATFGSVRVGDLLVTSPTEGYAMRVPDAYRGPGCILGKALRALPEGRGLIPILIALQ